jgi:biopolymer transport protein ExbD
MKFRKKPQVIQPRIDLTSLIDIMFIILVFFLLTSNFNIPSGISINLPKVKTSNRVVMEHHEININSLNQIVFKEKVVNLIDLKNTFSGLNNQMPVILRSDEDTTYGVVIKVFDLLRELEFEKVTLGTLKAES